MRQLANMVSHGIVISMATLTVLIFSLTSVMAQEGIISSGGNASGSGGEVSYSVGQVFYHTYTGSNGSVAEGVQQPFEISVITGINERHGITLSVSAFPNPTSSHLTLSINDFVRDDQEALWFRLYDISGRLLQTECIISDQTTIDVSHLMPAMYFLRVVKTNTPQEIRTFKIIKK